ncbi:MAG: nuclear transport factor 2 family protein [Balneola sp.]|nr:MAG: nuclear transport factor 2 family protein [Balneola sp.]
MKSFTLVTAITLLVIGTLTNSITTMETQNETQKITQTINKLFVYTDEQEWEKLQHQVFTEEVWLDMSSLGGPKETMKATDITSMWAEAYTSIDAVNHLGGNYIIDIEDDHAKVFAYATATQYKEAATEGKTREFVGTYNLELRKENGQWKLYSFQYNLKYMTGNIEFK